MSKSGTVPTLGHLPRPNLGMLIRLLMRLVPVTKFAHRVAKIARRRFRFIAAQYLFSVTQKIEYKLLLLLHNPLKFALMDRISSFIVHIASRKE